ncbi:MAG: phosphotransferase family protein [Pseudomonadota bacterium]|nr:phosphotransferase family protein [Pseudomonadota bacterium]
MTGDPEVIAIRPDERIDAGRLEAWLRQRLTGADGSFAMAQFGGGHANLTYLIRFGDREYVLRRPPLGPLAPSSHDMAREHRVLERLWERFPLAPRSYLFCGDKDIIGAEFHVLERRRGMAIRTTLPEGHDWTPVLCRRLGEDVVDVLAELHRVDAAAVGLGNLGRPEGFLARQIEGWTGRWEAAKDDQAPQAMTDIAKWLGRRLPRSGPAALLHNDFKLDNMLVDAAEPSRVTAVLDWDMCTRGDPLADLGYVLAFWGEAGDDPEWIEAASMPTWSPGFPTRDDVVERYARTTGFDCSDVLWYHVFGVFKIAVILQQIYIRYLRGQTQDARFAVFGRRVAGLAEKGRVLSGL